MKKNNVIELSHAIGTSRVSWVKFGSDTIVPIVYQKRNIGVFVWWKKLWTGDHLNAMPLMNYRPDEMLKHSKLAVDAAAKYSSEWQSYLDRKDSVRVKVPYPAIGLFLLMIVFKVVMVALALGAVSLFGRWLLSVVQVMDMSEPFKVLIYSLFMGSGTAFASYVFFKKVIIPNVDQMWKTSNRLIQGGLNNVFKGHSY